MRNRLAVPESGKKDTPLEVMLAYMWTLQEGGQLKDAMLRIIAGTAQRAILSGT
jgi:hypothetical protein